MKNRCRTRGARLLCTGALVTLIFGVGLFPASAQKAKDTLRYPLTNSESALDPYLVTGSYANTWAPSVFDTLLDFDAKDKIWHGHLAKSWTQPTPTTFEFVLRDDVKWQDGQPLSADDVVHTINYLIDPKVNLRYKATWDWLESVEKLGPYKVRITAKRALPNALMQLVPRTMIFPAHLHAPLANKQDFGARPIGTGPYRITKIEKNTGITAERFEGYLANPAKPRPAIGRIVAEPIPEMGTLVAALLTDRADIAEDVPSDQAMSLRDSGRFEITMTPPSVSYTFLGFPTTSWDRVKPLSDVRVRTAIMMAIDRKAIAITEFGDFSKDVHPAESICKSEQLGCGYTKPTPAYDPAGAKKLLAEAGYANGFDVVLYCFRAPDSIATATAIAGMMRQVGIRATVGSHTTAQRVQLIREGKLDMVYHTWDGGAVFEVSQNMARHFLSNEHEDPILAKMASDTFSIMDDGERRKAVAKVIDYATENAYLFAMLPNAHALTHSKDLRLLNPNVIRASRVAMHDFAWK